MARLQGRITRGSARMAGCAWRSDGRSGWWFQHREASLNWLALGVLLAAWNASLDDAAPSPQRPEALRRYSCVSVRAATPHLR